MRKLTIFILMFMTVMACSKYENGPFISFRSIKKRAIADWKLDEYLVNGQNQTESYTNGNEFWWKFKKDMTVQQILGGQQPVDGTWEFDSDNNIIVTLKMYSNAGVYYEMDTLNITRLTNTEMWVEDPGSIVKKYKAQ